MLADGKELFRRGLAALLETEVAVVGQATDGLAAIEQAHLCLPDVLVMDTDLPVLTGFEVCARVKEALPSVRVLMLSDSSAEADLIASVRAGASGYVLKDSSLREVIDALCGAAWSANPPGTSGAATVPDMKEFFQFAWADRQYVMRKRQWP